MPTRITEKPVTPITSEEAGYRRLVEVSPMPIAVHVQGELVFANHATAKLMGAESPEQLIGRNIMGFVHPDSQELVKKRVAAIYKEGRQTTDVAIEKLIRVDGEVIEVEIASLLFDYEGKPAIQLVLRDITEQAKARKELERSTALLTESEERFRQLADSMPQMVWTSRPDGQATYRNKKWYEFTGYDPKNDGTNDWYGFFHPDDKDIMVTAWRKALKTGKPLEAEFRLHDYRHPRKYRWFLSRAVPIRNHDGEITHWYGTTTDITDVRRTTQRKKELEHITSALTEQRAQLVALNQAKDEFISLASHQLRTPATGVKQYIGMALEGFAGEVSPELRTFLERAYESNERQIMIVNDLLQVAQVDAGKVTLQKGQTDIGDLIKSVIHEQASHFVDREQIISFKAPRTPVVVAADTARLRMVLDNIIDNASKYTPHGKMITIKIQRSTNLIKINIHDEGVGIDPADVEKIFRKFSRLDNPLSAHVGGSGLGLYWAQKIISLHDGTITVDSKVGAGSTFTISLPIST